jgi:hypothetical protein
VRRLHEKLVEQHGWFQDQRWYDLLRFNEFNRCFAAPAQQKVCQIL